LDWKKHLTTDERYYRPAEVDHLIGDATKAKNKLKWTAKTRIADLVGLMVDSDIERLKTSRSARNEPSVG